MATFWERAAHLVDPVFSLCFDYLYFKLFPVIPILVLRGGGNLGYDKTSFWSLPTCYFQAIHLF